MATAEETAEESAGDRWGKAPDRETELVSFLIR